MLSESEIKAVMDKYKCYLPSSGKYPYWCIRYDGGFVIQFDNHGKLNDAYLYCETVQELETVLKCLGIQKKPETFESEFQEIMDNCSMNRIDKIFKLHEKYHNKALDEIKVMLENPTRYPSQKELLAKIEELKK